ncbi:MAG: class I SAM-dependent methyltransferase [Dehalococcoidia bacterium]
MRDPDDRWTSPEAMAYRYGEERRAQQATAPSLYSFREPPLTEADAAALMPLANARAVLDAGCGTGNYLPHLRAAMPEGARLVGFDFSPIMLREASRHAVAAPVRGDVQRLPFAAAAFDVVLSAHMLYHVPDIRAAVREFRRVLRPGGTLVLVIGSERDQASLDDLFVAAGGAFPLARYSERFTAGNAPTYLDGIFTEVESVAVTPELVIRDAAVLLAHFEGERHWAEPALAPGVTWGAFRASLGRLAAEEIAARGAVRIPEEIVLLRCR